jgi:hypothetical protein
MTSIERRDAAQRLRRLSVRELLEAARKAAHADDAARAASAWPRKKSERRAPRARAFLSG